MSKVSTQLKEAPTPTTPTTTLLAALCVADQKTGEVVIRLTNAEGGVLECVVPHPETLARSLGNALRNVAVREMARHREHRARLLWNTAKDLQQ